MMSYNDFIDLEYSLYVDTMRDAGRNSFEFDEWLHNADYLESLYEELYKHD